MNFGKLPIKPLGSQPSDALVRAVANKWKFQDSMMGEQFITLTITSEAPIPWVVGDYCVFRGETFVLNYIPSVTQKAGTNERQDAYVYENMKFDSRREELTRCLMLDVTQTNSSYDASQGTNYTGSSQFQLYCGETTVEIEGQPVTRTAVCTLTDKMQSNLDRLYGSGVWSIEVDMDNTHTDEKVLTFDNMTVAQALAEIKNTFDLNYSVRGRCILVGYVLEDVTSDDEQKTFEFGYGKGYPTHYLQGRALTQIKRTADSNQMIITRLRVLGSTKNLPYRYYNKKYNLPQALFPTNLQLPDTFLPLGNPNGQEPNTKWANNLRRRANESSSSLRYVLGDTNDSYIDKGDNAESCIEGVREASVKFDGSGNLEEIFPTIEDVTYGELRAAGMKDMDGHTSGAQSYYFANYLNAEMIDRLLAVGHIVDDTLVDDANIGDGVLSTEGSFASIAYVCRIPRYSIQYNGGFVNEGDYYKGRESELFTVRSVGAGSYAIAPTYSKVFYNYHFTRASSSADVGFVITIKKKVGNVVSVIGTYVSSFKQKEGSWWSDVELPAIPDSENMEEAQVPSITITENCDVVVTFAPALKNVSDPSCVFVYSVGTRETEDDSDYIPQYNWIDTSSSSVTDGIFHVFLKDMGFEISPVQNGEPVLLAMKSGGCVGRDFEVSSVNGDYTIDGKRGRLLTLKRATDKNLNTYYPSSVSPLSSEDKFVLLNINMPDEFIAAAEVRLLSAATDYLADHCETTFTYQPSIDDIYLRRNYDRLKSQNKEEESIFWRLYAGLIFSFKGIPADKYSQPLSESITIESVTITMGEGLTPKVEIKLNDDVQQSTLQKTLSAVNKLYGDIKSGAIGVGGKGVYADHYIGTTKAQDSAKPQAVTGIESVSFSKTPNGAITPPSNEKGLEVQEINGERVLHTSLPFYSDSWVASGGVGSPGGGGGGGASALSELSDVEVSGAESGDVLTYDGQKWVAQEQQGGGGGGGASYLGQLEDVSVPNPSDGQVLAYDASANKWKGTIIQGDKNMAYTARQDSASDRWTIEHNLGKAPSVTVVDSAGRQFFGDVVYGMKSTDTFDSEGVPNPTGDPLEVLTVFFAAAFSGVAYLN